MRGALLGGGLVFRRWRPLLATAGLIVFEAASSLWWGPAIVGARHWSLPEDMWSTLVAAQRLMHGDLAGLYTPPTALVSFPGTALMLVPLVALLAWSGIPLGPDWSTAAHPAAWLLTGPYEIALAAVPLFAADYIAERRSVTARNRLLLAAAEAIALWGVTVRWGHPEDALATGLVLYAYQADSPVRKGWLVGAAVAVQPLVLLAVPVLMVDLPLRRFTGFLVRAALPAVVLLGAALAANPAATVRAVFHQPNYPSVDHPTLWTSLAPRMADGSVASGPGRLAAIALACLIAFWLRRRGTSDLLWWVAVALALRSVFEPVMVAYYLWPPMAVALIVAATRGRLAVTALATTTITMAAQVAWRSPWVWWVPLLIALAITLALARGTGTRRLALHLRWCLLTTRPHVIHRLINKVPRLTGRPTRRTDRTASPHNRCHTASSARQCVCSIHI